MKPGNVGKALIIGILAGAVFFLSMRLTEVPKLKDRVDELTVQNQELQEGLKSAETAYNGMAELNGQLENKVAKAYVLIEETQGKLDEKTRKVEALEVRRVEHLDRIKVLQAENAKLKKTEPVRTVSRGESYGKLLGNDYQVTWYNDNGQTASGKWVQDGVTVAVDPEVIPLGSLLRITFPDGRVMERTAHDTGSAVKGRIVDIYARTSTAELKRRGRTHGVKVELLRRGW